MNRGARFRSWGWVMAALVAVSSQAHAATSLSACTQALQAAQKEQDQWMGPLYEGRLLGIARYDVRVPGPVDRFGLKFQRKDLGKVMVVDLALGQQPQGVRDCFGRLVRQYERDPKLPIEIRLRGFLGANGYLSEVNLCSSSADHEILAGPGVAPAPAAPAAPATPAAPGTPAPAQSAPATPLPTAAPTPTGSPTPVATGTPTGMPTSSVGCCEKNQDKGIKNGCSYDETTNYTTAGGSNSCRSGFSYSTGACSGNAGATEKTRCVGYWSDTKPHDSLKCYDQDGACP